ncbi:hypothetical protein C8R47DRAFT_1328847 [Mycena vitilis]|nr:hypothetical protein C8R47DRAFT_1328847 [Mycena vitilis]
MAKPWPCFHQEIFRRALLESAWGRGPGHKGLALDPIIGALLLGTWGASILTGVVIVQAYTYFTSFPDDPLHRKALVSLVLALCAAALAADYATTYYPAVTFWGQIEGLTTIFWSLPMASFVNTLIACIVNSYLIFRLYTLTKNIWVMLTLYALLTLALGGQLIVFILLLRKTDITERHTETIGAIIDFIAMATVDLLTAGGLIWKLRTMRSTFAPTNTFLNRVMLGAIQTGSVTAVCSLLILATFLNNPDSDVSTFFMFQFAPLYSLTLLFNFNLRRPNGLRSGTSKTSESRNGNTGLMRSEGIHVHRTAVVTMDPIDPAVSAAQRRLDALDEVKHHSNSDLESFNGPHEMADFVKN